MSDFRALVFVVVMVVGIFPPLRSADKEPAVPTVRTYVVIRGQKNACLFVPGPRIVLRGSWEEKRDRDGDQMKT